jgi:hypothetical protein
MIDQFVGSPLSMVCIRGSSRPLWHQSRGHHRRTACAMELIAGLMPPPLVAGGKNLPDEPGARPSS